MEKSHHDFKKRVTIIISVYNVGGTLSECLDSLVNQSMDPKEMEIILINNGSTDNSLEICHQYAKGAKNIEVFDIENDSLSGTRNYGIKKAQGRYIMYLDANAKLTLETVGNVTDYFDGNYDEVDMVTYSTQSYKDDKKNDLNPDFNFFRETGIYNLIEYPFIVQTQMNICVKNCFEENLLFDEKTYTHEGQKYCSEILSSKMKLGYVAEAEYLYSGDNDYSGVSTFNVIKHFESSTKYFEQIFEQFNSVPKYFQMIYIHDLSWRLKAGTLYPFHYEKDELKNAIERVNALLSKVDIDIIESYPNNIFYKAYWLNQKQNSNTTVVSSDNGISLLADDKVIYETSRIEIVINRIYINNRKVKILALFRSPIFNFVDVPNFFAVENNEKTRQLDVSLAYSSYYLTKILTNRFWGFEYSCNIDELNSLKFIVEIEGNIHETSYSHMYDSPLGNYSSYCVDNIEVSLKNNVLNFEEIENTSKVEEFIATSMKFSKDIKNIRSNVKRNTGKKIWLYYDNLTVAKDNGYFQFIHDFDKKDGIDRYYICANKQIAKGKMFEDKHSSHLVEYFSEQHKILYLSSEKVLTSFAESKVLNPFSDEDWKMYVDLFNAEVIYLQHGVLHANLPWYYTKHRLSIDKVVVSTKYEVENFQKNYGFNEKDLILTGMARFDSIKNYSKPKNKIIFAPSWRSYLIGPLQRQEPLRRGMEETLLNSNYYKQIMEFVNDERLALVLEENDLFLELKLHPIFSEVYGHLIQIKNDRVTLAEKDIRIEEYSAFITDFSSFVFDYVYLNRPILYFVPDMVEFKSGMNHYRQLDLSFEEAFGDLTTAPKDAVQALEKIVDNNFIPEEKYLNRMKNFYPELENCSENLYLALKN